MLDQARLPGEECHVALRSAVDVARSIRTLQVRGAPAIGIAGALGLALELRRLARAGTAPAPEAARQAHDLLFAARPTGRNLGWGLRRVLEAFLDGYESDPGGSVDRACDAALGVWEGEVRRCRSIGEHALEVIPDAGATILLHCNAGALATGGLGTATAPLYLAHEQGRTLRAFAGETRPVLQGARLTAWELSRAGIPVTVVTDSMAGALMASGVVDLVIVGADAVAPDGTVVNKIGTYGLAVLADYHAVPFYVAAPSTTLEPRLEAMDIPVEERDDTEVRSCGDRLLVPPDASVWNPAFDRTPPHLITAILTEAGILRPPFAPRLRTLAQDTPGALPDG